MGLTGVSALGRIARDCFRVSTQLDLHEHYIASHNVAWICPIYQLELSAHVFSGSALNLGGVICRLPTSKVSATLLPLRSLTSDDSLCIDKFIVHYCPHCPRVCHVVFGKAVSNSVPQCWTCCCGTYPRRERARGVLRRLLNQALLLL